MLWGFILIFFALDLGTVAALQSSDARQGCLDVLTESKRKKLASILIYGLTF